MDGGIEEEFHVAGCIDLLGHFDGEMGGRVKLSFLVFFSPFVFIFFSLSSSRLTQMSSAPSSMSDCWKV